MFTEREKLFITTPELANINRDIANKHNTFIDHANEAFKHINQKAKNGDYECCLALTSNNRNYEITPSFTSPHFNQKNLIYIEDHLRDKGYDCTFCSEECLKVSWK